MFKKADIILAVFLIAAGLFMSYSFSLGKSAGSSVDISCNGKLFGTYSLAEDRVITVDLNGHCNKVTINNGTVSMSFSDCTGQDCIHHAPIKKTGENIVCLPNKVVVEISAKDSDEYDSISR